MSLAPTSVPWDWCTRVVQSWPRQRWSIEFRGATWLAVEVVTTSSLIAALRLHRRLLRPGVRVKATRLGV